MAQSDGHSSKIRNDIMDIRLFSVKKGGICLEEFWTFVNRDSADFSG